MWIPLEIHPFYKWDAPQMGWWCCITQAFSVKCRMVESLWVPVQEPARPEFKCQLSCFPTLWLWVSFPTCWIFILLICKVNGDERVPNSGAVEVNKWAKMYTCLEEGWVSYVSYHFNFLSYFALFWFLLGTGKDREDERDSSSFVHLCTCSFIQHLLHAYYVSCMILGCGMQRE